MTTSHRQLNAVVAILVSLTNLAFSPHQADAIRTLFKIYHSIYGYYSLLSLSIQEQPTPRKLSKYLARVLKKLEESGQVENFAHPADLEFFRKKN